MSNCIICKQHKPLTAEHIIPEFLGGNLVVRNVCRECNSKMGSGFEGRLSNSLFYKMPRFLHSISGKSEKAPYPFEGVHSHEETGSKFRADENGDLTLIPEIEIVDNSNGLSVNMSIDVSEFDNAKYLLEKKLTRHFKSVGNSVDKKKLSVVIDELMEKSQKQHSSINQPKIHGRISLDLDALHLLYVKIAYELACFHFGQDYLDDPVADELRNSLHSQKLSSLIQGQIPMENDPYKEFLDDDNHWVVFSASGCYIRIFGFSAVIKYVSDSSVHQVAEGAVYRFCYKTQSYECNSLVEHLGRWLPNH